ncbi:TonB-dependent receptor [soil metagenome]
MTKANIGRSRMRFYTSATLLALIAPTTAWAQTAPPAGPAQEGAGADTIADIVVTAQRRSESAQNVPISVTALSSSQLEASGVVSLPQIAQLTPGLQFQAIGSANVPFLRGVGSTSTIIGSEAATAIYVDGVYLSNQSIAYMSLPNIESVVVSKGPQGTLFGRNATAGVIQITTRRPSHDTSVELRAGYANYGTTEATFYGTTGLGSNAAIDLSLSHMRQGDGWGKNLFDGSDIYTRSDVMARSRLAIDFGADTNLTLSGDFERIKGQAGFANRLPNGNEVGPAERGLLSGVSYTGGFYDADYNFPSYSRTSTYGASASLEHSFGGVEFRSITAFRKTDVYQSVDFDFTPASNAALILPIRDKTFSQEFQLLSSDGNKSALKWIVGAYYYFQDARYVDGQQFGTLFTLPPALAGSPTQVINFNSQQKTNSFSGFGQATYAVSDKANLTAGLRYTSDERCLDATQANPAFTTPLLPLTQRACQTFPKVTWRGVADYHIAPDVMVYAQYSRGFKSGFFNAQSLQSAPGTPRSTPLAVRPETLDAYEVGVKSDLFGRRARLNVSAFYYDYKDLQVNAFIDPTNRITINAASAQVKGVEAELTARPVRGLELSLSGAYLDSRYDSFPGAPAFTPRSVPPFGLAVSQSNAEGNRLPNAPNFSGTAAATYTYTLADLGKITLNGTAYYNGGYFFDPQNRLKQPEHVLLNASIRWSLPGDRYSVSVWGNNLTDRHLFATINPNASGDAITPAAPRTYGIRLGAKF